MAVRTGDNLNPCGDSVTFFTEIKKWLMRWYRCLTWISTYVDYTKIIVAIEDNDNEWFAD